jgi:4-hydroxy-tetrahydrodipicolinate reductase
LKNLFISGITGKVGKLLSSYALESNHFKLVGGSCSSDNNFFGKDVGKLLEIDEIGIQISEKMSEDLSVDIIIDFSSPKSSMKILQLAKIKEIPILIGTTGFSEDDFKEIEIASTQIPVLFAPNTSSGIAILKNILNKSRNLFSEDNEFSISETHHIEKKDSPSGTALDLQREIISVYPEAKVAIESYREGNNPGEHTVSINLDNEIIEFTHKAENRSIFALGALKGAVWLTDRPAGLYSMGDIYSS